MNRKKLWVGVVLLSVGFFAILWSGSMDCMSEQERLDRMNAQYRPIHDKLDKQIEKATKDDAD